MKRTPLQALASSPTMVGAITTLIVIVAVFLAYNANNGLPFVPTYRVNVDIPNAARLVRNNEVRIGGHRVGVVESISAVSAGRSAGSAPSREGHRRRYRRGARHRHLGRSARRRRRPADPEARRERRAAAAGLDLPGPLQVVLRPQVPRDHPGRRRPARRRASPSTAPTTSTAPDDDDDQILSLDEADENPGAADGTFIDQTEFDDIGNTFDQRTRNAGRQNLLGFGNALAGRGASLNLAIESLNPLFTNLKPVAKVLDAAGHPLRALVPRARGRRPDRRAGCRRSRPSCSPTWRSPSARSAPTREALQETIPEGPPTLQTGIDVLPAQQTFLAEFTELSRRLQPGRPPAAPGAARPQQAVAIGTPVLLNRTPQMNRDLRAVFVQLEDLVDQPTTLTTLQRLQETFDKSDSLAECVTPAQTVCNYWNYWMTLLPEHLTEKDSTGFTQRVSLISTPPGPLTVSAGGVPLTIPGEVETGLSIGGYSGLQANGKAGRCRIRPTRGCSSRASCRSCTATRPARPARTAATASPARPATCSAAAPRIPGQSNEQPGVGVPDLPGDRGPTTVFFEAGRDPRP